MEKLELLKEKNVGIYVAATGAGAGIQDLLWSVPGASKFLLGASFPYSSNEFDKFIGYRKGTGYCSADGATELAMASYIRARETLIFNEEWKKNAIGIGISAAVTTDRTRLGDNRVFITVITDQDALSTYIKLDNYSLTNEAGRLSDGNLVDFYIENAIFSVLNIEQNKGAQVKLQELIPSEFRKLFFARPLYTPYGTKEPAHKIGVGALLPGTFNPLHDKHRIMAQETNATYYVDATSPHKKDLSVQDMLDRVAQVRADRFNSLSPRSILFTENKGLFIEKARAFPGSTFVIGIDTVERMLDPKWGTEIIPMLYEFNKLLTTFCVFSREHKILKDITIPGEFSRLFQEVEGNWPDISSTEIRNRRNVT